MVVDEFGRWKYVMNVYVKDQTIWINYDFGGKLYILYSCVTLCLVVIVDVVVGCC